MKLTRIRLTGFKSFAGPVELPFGEGMTAIVGPNGCGKSNISDAVRWVLGEQRARLLRGQTMEDVIFHGAAKHRPVNLAEVSLIFDNEDGMLPISYREVDVARRLSRSGQSDYVINGSSVRLRDVQDLLRGTGLGSNAGVVIEAQMIDRLLSDRAEERRSLFEEAAGIGLYRDRKTSTERQLEHTSEDLVRLDDVIGEVQREVRSLARQRGKAERHVTFTGERFNIVITLAQRDLAQFDAAAVQLDAARDTMRVRIPEVRQEVSAHERERDAAFQARHTAEARRTEMERRLAESRLQIERLEGDLKVAGEKLQNATARTARAESERSYAAERAAQAERDKAAAADERHAAAEARASVQGELDLRTATEAEARERLLATRAAVTGVEDRLAAHTQHARALAGEQESLERDLGDLTKQLAEAERARAQFQAEREAAGHQVREARALGDERHNAERAAETETERARHALAAAREHESAVRSERRAAEEELARLAARRDALERLERDREGLAPAARQLLEVRDQFGPNAVLGPLSDFVRTSQNDAVLAERLFGEWLHAVLVRDDAVVADVRRWHATQRPGPLVLLPATGPTIRQPTGSSPLQVTTEGPAALWTRVLLADHDILDPGAIRRPNGAVVLATDDDGAGPLARRASLEALSADLRVVQERVDDLGRQQDEAARAHGDAERALETATEDAEQARAAYREAQGALDDAGRLLQRVEREVAARKEECSRLTERISTRRDRLGAISDETERATDGRQRLDEDLAGKRASLAEVELQQEAARERRVHWQVEEAQVSAREDAAREREELAGRALAEARREIAALNEELAAIEADSGGLSRERQEWTDELAERRVAVQELEQAAVAAERAVGEADTRVAEAERELDEVRARQTALGEEAHQTELAHTELHGRRQALVERIEGEWHKPIDVLLEAAEDIEGDLDALRAEAERLQAVLEAMGPVNSLAVEEHAEATERLQFLTSQREDLVEARDKLREALHEIDRTARAMFVETFDAIRENFHDVFRTLFEGGECDLRLADPSDALASEIDIHAAPPGKRTQRIHLLSSGERALVAISLLFSIYLTKPSPFCLLDEVDAPLDDANVVRFIRLLSEFKQDTQFIVITHNPRTMQVADAVFGVTMQEPGVSTIVGVRLGELELV